MSSCKNNFLILIWILVLIGFFITPITIGYVYDFNVEFVGLFIGIYGFYSLSHYIFQLIFAILNNREMNLISEMPRKNTTIGIQMVGYKENPEYYRLCLESIANVNDPNIRKKVIIIDGNDNSVAYMIGTFNEIFPDGYHLNIPKPFTEMNNQERQQIFDKLSEHYVVCISQPHRGKREAMYTGSKVIIKENLDYVLMMDSDTILEKNSPTQLAKTLDNIKDSVAVTGDVRIFNITNFLSYVTSFKYWAAFNLERAGQSYFGVVSCVSGPLGLYRVNILKQVIDKWRKQNVCGIKATYGDDRHLTNLFLNFGTVYYNQNAICYTETPTTFSRFIAQQTRWGKSFLREYFVGIPGYYIRSWWLGYEMSFLLTYSYFLIFFSIILLERDSLESIVYLFTGIVLISALRSIYGSIVKRDLSYLLFSVYGLLYFIILLPLKLWSLLTFLSNSWGTGNRNTKKYVYIDIVSVLAWVGYIIYRIYRKIEIDGEWIKMKKIYIPLTITSVYVFLLLIFLPFSRNGKLKKINQKFGI